MDGAAIRVSTCQEHVIPFNFFARLIEEFAKVKPQRATQCSAPCSFRKHIDVLDSWIARLDRPLPPGTGAVLFRLLFPCEDKDRKYNLQESKLSRLLADIFVVDVGSGKRGHRLSTWQDSDEGCLGREVQMILMEVYSGEDHPTNPTIHEADSLLEELAATSPWSNIKFSTPSPQRRSAKRILSDLYRDLTPFGAAVMTQVLLKDLRPLAYPQPAASMSASLIDFNSKAYEEITPHMAMRAWHPKMCYLYKTNSKLDAVADAVEKLESWEASVQPGIRLDPFSPMVGVPVEIAKCVQGHSYSYALSRLVGSERVYAETKYDGERMQIHVDFSQPASSQIRIFSKSKRDSTQDRIATHSIIRASLGIHPGSKAHEKLLERLGSSTARTSVIHSAILEAEMVAYCELSADIDKFWRIRGILGATARGVRRRAPRKAKYDSDISDSEDETRFEFSETQDSLVSNGTASETRHFMLVYFDILQLNGTSLLRRPYEHRRFVLKQVIAPVTGFTRIARSLTIGLGGSQSSASLERLQQHFRRETEEYKEEGIVLKAGESVYNDYQKPWIKIKRDYIRGYGDTLDFVILGTGWSKERGRELRVGPSVNTTFHVGCVTNMAEVKLQRSVRPHFEVYFTVEYGFCRDSDCTLVDLIQ
ncbi:DNA ligase/mRNA capping enzyme [Dacryopinax primogenitus]|uniref:DNA ligase/mRNA capping enzyme n=1 Tax=Dacryopinax primogenitus (strain DJM 731) TaxID=1858805 RepID=M5FVE6_DACPD|nr:DNA ligase/mRNA capping enzyme [Dacryopinax primogenitus]EJU01771.1 DNA ligase/mRNA capping enzyme [Dacryopinax primogenitus]